VVFDVLEWEGEDVRDKAFSERRSLVEELDAGVIRPSDIVSVSSVHEAKELWSSARERKVEGFLVKRRDSTYSGGRERGTWWKWKVDPLELDTVLMYAQMGHGKRANLHSDYTLGVWDGEDLVPIGKAYSGLTDEELEEMDAWIRSHTVEKYGPVRSVEQGQVFELHFDGIVPSPQRKAGMSLRFPRIARWRRDLDAEDADSLEAARALMEKFDQHVTSKEQNASLDEFL
jgi:DNA ligase-1